MPETKIKVWIVRNSARNVQFGGLERLFVHFSKPTFYYTKRVDKTGEMIFNEPSEINGIFDEAGWRETYPKTWVQPLSVGNLIGTDNELANYIWVKLCEHFKNKPMDTWDTMEQCLEVKRENFCLEVELTLNMTITT